MNKLARVSSFYKEAKKRNKHMRFEIIFQKDWHSPTSSKTSSWYMVEGNDGKLYVVIASQGGNGKGGSSNYGRPELIDVIKARLSRLGVEKDAVEVYKSNLNTREISNTSRLTIKDLNNNAPYAIRFENMTASEGKFLCADCSSENEALQDVLLEKTYKEEQEEARATYLSRHARNATLANEVRKRDGYKCQYPHCCNFFRTAGGNDYVEVHHLKPLAQGGRDCKDNMVCLCAYHHSKIHYADQETRKEMTEDLVSRIRRRKDSEQQ